jgi:hypothetical protein
MSTYLLSCPCSNQISIEMGQAGGQITCSNCGRTVDVPTLRQLRHLPQQREEPKTAASTWTTRKGWTTGSLIVVLVLLAWSAWSKYKDPQLPKFELADRLAAVEHQMKSPAGAWDSWVSYYKPLAEHGFPVFHASNTEAILQEVANRQFFRKMLWSIAGIFALAAVSGMFWPEPQPITRDRGIA